jgi:hypothetical protein
LTEKQSDDKIGVAAVKALGDLSEESIRQAGKTIQALYSAAKSNPLLGVVAAVFTIDFFQKLKLIWPNSAQATREAIFTALGLQFNLQSATNLKAWEQDIPILGFFTTSTNIQYESILKTSVTVDATGGESIIKEAVGQAGASERASESEDTKRILGLLAKLLPEAATG